MWMLPSLFVWAPTVWSRNRPWSILSNQFKEVETFYQDRLLGSSSSTLQLSSLLPAFKKKIADALTVLAIWWICTFGSSACCPFYSENQRDWPDLGTRSRVAWSQKLPHWRKLRQCSQAKPSAEEAANPLSSLSQRNGHMEDYRWTTSLNCKFLF